MDLDKIQPFLLPTKKVFVNHLICRAKNLETAVCETGPKMDPVAIKTDKNTTFNDY